MFLIYESPASRQTFTKQKFAATGSGFSKYLLFLYQQKIWADAIGD